MPVLALVPASEPSLKVEVYAWTGWAAVAPTWAAIAASCPHTNLFLLPEIVEAWVHTFGQVLAPEVLVFRDRERAVGACVLVRRRERKGPFLVHRVYLGTAGEADADSVCIEYNGLLCRPGLEGAMARALRAHLDQRRPVHRWDELVAPGLSEGPALEALRAAFVDAFEVDDAKASYAVDLAELRRTGAAYVDRLSGYERTRYRRNVRRYSELGALTLVAAGSVAEALAFLDALAVLHQQTWISRGEPGAFASATFRAYHRRLIERGFPLGHIEVLRLCAGEAVVGYHYSLLVDGASYFYQCGYAYALDAKASPGIVMHGHAIARALAQGRTGYELMAGDADYKRRLGTVSRRMHWIAWQAPTRRMRTFALVRRARRAARLRVLGLRAKVGHWLGDRQPRLPGQARP